MSVSLKHHMPLLLTAARQFCSLKLFCLFFFPPSHIVYFQGNLKSLFHFYQLLFRNVLTLYDFNLK